MPPHPHLDLLRIHPALAELADTELEALAERGQLRSARRQHVAYLPGDVADQVFLLHDGRINDIHIHACGRAIGLAHHHPGDLFGEECCWTARTRDTMAVAATRVLYSALPRDDLHRVLSARSTMERALYGRLLERQARAAERLCTALARGATARVAAVLLEFAEYGVDTEEGRQLPAPLPQREIAAFAATIRETVAVELGRLEAMRILHRIGRLIVLVDRERLSTLADSTRPLPDPRPARPETNDPTSLRSPCLRRSRGSTAGPAL